MRVFRMAILLGLLGLGIPTVGTAQQMMTVKRGGTAELGRVYWIRDCHSNLDDFEGVELKTGGPGVSLSLRKQEVRPSQNCGTTVPGAVVVAAVAPNAALGNVNIEYLVRYRTKTGAKEVSTHTRILAIVQ